MAVGKAGVGRAEKKRRRTATDELVVGASREDGGEKTGCRLYLLSMEEGVPHTLKVPVCWIHKHGTKVVVQEKGWK
jgi:hypothetical protein